jgi:hypothetical protein
MALYKISSSRVNNIEATEFVGGTNELGLIWYDEVTGLLRLYNGEPGGRIINNTGGNSIQSEIVNGSSNVVVYPDGNVAISINGTANVAVFSNPEAEFDNVVLRGNLTVGNNTVTKDVLPADDDLYDLGSPDKKFRSLYVGGNTIYLGSELVKVDPSTGTWTFTSSGANVVLGADVAFNPPSIETTGNVSASFFIGDGSQLTGIAAALPDQTGQQGKFLSTNGVDPSWQTVAGVFGLTIDGGDAAEASTDLVIDAGGA